MKKLAYLSAIAGLFMTACVAEYTVDPAEPQSWEQEEFVTLQEGVTVTAVEAIDLAKVKGDTVVVGNMTPVAVAEGEVKYSVIFEGPKNTYKYPAGSDLSVAVDSLQKMVVADYGKRPDARKFSAMVYADVVVDGQASLITSAEFDVVLTPVAPYIDNAYYLVGDMFAVYNEEKDAYEGGWDKDAALKFNHSGKDVYEDSEFTLIVKVPDYGKDGADYWKIIPGVNYDSADGFWAEGVLGPEKNGDDAKEGTLVTSNPGAGKINFNKDEKSMNLYKITLNMMDYTYKVEELNFVEYIYVPGNHQSWTPKTAPALHGPEFNGVWTGYTMLDGGFKFVHQRDWGADYTGKNFTTLPEGFTSDGGDIVAPAKGFYYLTVDIPSSKLTVKEIKSYGIIGDATPGGWDGDTDLTWNAEKGAFVISGVTLKAGEIKFRANDGWDINLGGAFDNLVANGDNIKVEAGTYDIELYLQRTDNDKLYAKVTKK